MMGLNYTLRGLGTAWLAKLPTASVFSFSWSICRFISLNDCLWIQSMFRGTMTSRHGGPGIEMGALTCSRRTGAAGRQATAPGTTSLALSTSLSPSLSRVQGFLFPPDTNAGWGAHDSHLAESVQSLFPQALALSLCLVRTNPHTTRCGSWKEAERTRLQLAVPG